MEQFEVAAQAGGAYVISGDTINISSEEVKVLVDGREAPVSFAAESKLDACIGKIKGVIFGAESNIGGIGITREIFLSDDRLTAAVRIIVRNSGVDRFHLDSITPMHMTRQSSFVVGRAGIDKWKVLRYPFHKSDIPSYYKPSVVDKDFTDAVFSCINAIPGKGVLYNTMNTDTRTITSGPVMMVKNFEETELPILMFATTGIENHFILQSLTTTEDRQSFADFNILCDFGGMEMGPGEQTGTHWLLITTGDYEGALLDKYMETVADIYHVVAPEKPSLTVFCTWYFYTFLINEQYVLEELAAIKEKKIPLDVFQVDDGWMDTYGTYAPHPGKFPRGMKFIADRIKEGGMIPGIWAAPFVIDAKSPVVEMYPDIYQKDAEGNFIIYETDRDCYVLDPTAVGAKEYLQQLFRKFKDWGYGYYKLDWLRCIYEFSNTRFKNRNFNRTSAYYLAMSYIREIIGPEAYLLACGGLADPGSIGLVNGSRTSKDVRGIWNGPEGVPKSGAVIQLKQNLLRNHINRLYDSDPDATQIRVRHERFSELETRCVGVFQSEGHYTDDEARTICTHQYLAGGIITISERFPELQDERLALLRNISPAITKAAHIVDYDTPECPTLFLNDVCPSCRELGDYWTLTIGNWEDHVVSRNIKLGSIRVFGGNADKYAVFEFYTQRFIGIFSRDDAIGLDIPVHGVRVLRIIPWTGDKPAILGTDLHITGGAAEIAELQITGDSLSGTIRTRWQYPVVITAAFPEDGGVLVKQAAVPAGGGMFKITK